MKYFGILDNNDGREFEITDIEEILFEKNLYENRFSLESLEKMLDSGFDQKFEGISTEFKPASPIIDDFTQFLFHHYSAHIIVQDYFVSFNDYIYGLELNEQKKVALEAFSEVYNKFDLKTPTMISETISQNGVKNILNEGRLFKVYVDLLQKKMTLATTENMLHFLMGDAEFYDDEFLKKGELVEMLNFKIYSEILSQLNDRFDFEKDKYFSGFFSDSFIYDQYSHIFNSKEICHFINRYLRSIDTILPSHIYAIYEFLTDHDLIKKNQVKFIEFINDIYLMELTKIHSYKNKQENREHTKKIENLTQLWTAFDQFE